MNFPQNLSIEEAFALAEAEAKLKQALQEMQQRFDSAVLPNRYNEDWRFGQPKKYAGALAEQFAANTTNNGFVSISAPQNVSAERISAEDADLKETLILMPTIGSDALLGMHIKRFGCGCCIMLEPDTVIDTPITITYEVSEGLYTPCTFIMAGAGAKATIIEKHICHNGATIFCTRNIHVAQGADIAVELQEAGTEQTRAFNITNIQNLGGKVRHLTGYTGHSWVREETVAEIYSAEEGTEIKLYSANKLSSNAFLDQHTRQIHHVGGAGSDLLYKNVVDDHATAIFAGNIYVAEGAHHTDAYQSNRNMLLSENATIHSLPGLEILADKVKCSHGSASAPMDEEQLFYLCSRGISRRDAQLLVAEGFLTDVRERFQSRTETS